MFSRRLDLGLAGAIIAGADNWGSADPTGSEALENDDSTRDSEQDVPPRGSELGVLTSARKTGCMPPEIRPE